MVHHPYANADRPARSPAASIKEEPDPTPEPTPDPPPREESPDPLYMPRGVDWEDPQDEAFITRMEEGKLPYTHDDLMEYADMVSASMPRTYKEAIKRDDGHLWQECYSMLGSPQHCIP